jgi:hypothetical protein
MKRVVLEISDDAYQRMTTMVRVASIADPASSITPLFAKILDTIEFGRDVCTFETSKEKEAREGKKNAGQ